MKPPRRLGRAVKEGASDGGGLGCAGRIDRKAAGTESGQNQQPAHNRKVLLELDHVADALGPLLSPKVVKDEGSWDQIEKHDPGGESRVQANKDGQPTQYFNDQCDGNSHCWQGQMLRCGVSLLHRKGRDFGDSAENENRTDQNATQQRHHPTRRVRHGRLLFEPKLESDPNDVQTNTKPCSERDQATRKLTECSQSAPMRVREARLDQAARSGFRAAPKASEWVAKALR